MGKYCETYKITCTCITCENVECGYSPRTRAEAEIARGVKLDKFGNEVGKADIDRPAPSVAPAAPRTEIVAARKPSRLPLALIILLLGMTIGGVFFLMMRQNASVPTGVAIARPVATPAPTATPTVSESPFVDENPAPTPLPTLAPTPVETPEEKAVAVLPSTTPVSRAEVRQQAQEFKASGNKFVEQGNLVEAREFYQRAVEAFPDFYEGYNNLGNTYSDQGQYTAAGNAYQDGLRISPDSPYLKFNMANNDFRAGRYEKAVKGFNELLTLQPEDIESQLLCGISQYRLKNYAEAAKHFETIIKRNPEHAEALYNLHLAYTALGQSSMAQSYYREAIRLDPNIANSSDTQISRYDRGS